MPSDECFGRVSWIIGMDRRGGLPSQSAGWSQGVGQGGVVDGMTILFIEGVLYVTSTRIARCCMLFRVVDKMVDCFVEV